MELVEITDKLDRRLFTLLMKKYHGQGYRPGLAPGTRLFVGVVEGYWVCGAYLHLAGQFYPIFMKARVSINNSYFLRRIARFAPGDYLLEFMDLLFDKLRSEGKEAIVTLGLERHSNALYKKAGFKQVGIANGKPIFVKYLR